MSEEQVHYHYDKHHSGYVTKFNAVAPPELLHLTWPDIATYPNLPKNVLNLASQIYNHQFFWNCLTPDPKLRGKIPNDLVHALNVHFDSVEKFKQAFTNNATNHFGSGWVWLTWNPSKQKLQLFEGHDADNPLRHELLPMLTIDVWEHAYYIDYKNERGKYVEKFWDVVNWSFVASNLNSAIKAGKKDL